MPKICYVEKKFGAAALATIERANAIIEDYSAQGYELTLRQIYYQFVSRDFIANNMREYKNLGAVLNDGRLAGLIDWNAIVDRTRNLESNAHWDNPAGIIDSAANSFRMDKWKDQPNRVEVWVEKDALVGVIERAAREMDVAYFSCRGYTSQSELWSAGRRLAGYERGGQTTVVIHLGDHDPSGIDMSRDIQERLEMFSRRSIEVKRIALNKDQVEEYNPPPNPAKLTDSRANGYIAEFGNESWELDALEPSVLHELIIKTITELRDQEKWDAVEEEEATHREKLANAAKRWTTISKRL